MKFLHSMVRVRDLDASLDFYCKGLGLKEIKRIENKKGKFTLVFLAVEEGAPSIELTYNWGSKEDYGNARNFGHIAFAVDNIYEYCSHLQSRGIDILRPPRDGHMAFVKSPDQISIEILQKGESLPQQEPWASMKNQGDW